MEPRAERRRRQKKHEKVTEEAQRRFHRCETIEATARSRFDEDIKFVEGDSDNLYQWPGDVQSRLEESKQAMLTINKTKQHCLDVMNDARQSRVAIKIRPTGDGASVESAELFMGVVRHVEYISNASSAYQHGLSFAVRGGIGYWRVVTDYANDNSFDQECFIRRIRDPKMVYLDPDINEFDGSDARFGFVFTDTPRDQFDAENPEFKNGGAPSNTGWGPTTWVTDKTVRTAEYFRRVETTEWLLAYDDDENGMTKVARESQLSPELVAAIIDLPSTRKRRVKSWKVEWFKIVGNEVLDEREWPGIYVPIVRCVGEETWIDGQLDRKGLTRCLKDAQRMFNYNASGSVEYGALQSKTPWTGPADAIEGFEDYWNNANTEAFSFLAWNHRDDEGNEIPEPKRTQPPMGAPVYMQGMMDAAEWMRMVSGQYQSDMGAPSNERSGAAINARQRQGDNATYHYLDHQAAAIRFTGKILIDLIPKVYDTKRVLKMRGEDDKESLLQIDPNAPQAVTKTKDGPDAEALIFNPNVGKYEVEADVGPAYATRRQEAWNAFTQLLSQNKELLTVIGDLAFKFADFPGAQEISERLRRMVPQQALQDGPSPDLEAAKQQIEALTGLVQQLGAKLADKVAEQRTDQEKVAVTAYDAQTKRLAALKDALITDPEGLVSLVRQVIMEAEVTSGPGLGPALQVDMPQPVLPAPQAAPAPGGGLPDPAMSGGDDMGAGPPAAPGAPPVG